MKLSVVIVSYDCAAELAGCLASLPAGLAGLDYEVIVVDNASSDGSLEAARRSLPGGKVIASPVNRGFSAGNNLGISASSGEFLLLLNPDAALFPGAVKGMLDFMDAEPRAGVVGPAFAASAGGSPAVRPGIYRFPGLKDELFADTLLSRLAAALRPVSGSAAPAPRGSGPAETDWVSGACMLVRRKAAEEAGPMDEDFFLYMEEVDWCLRMKRKGWRVFILPDLGVAHSGGRSTSSLPGPERARTYYESRYRFFAKHWPAALIPFLKAAKVGLLCATAAWDLLAAPFRGSAAGAGLAAARCSIGGAVGIIFPRPVRNK